MEGGEGSKQKHDKAFLRCTSVVVPWTPRRPDPDLPVDLTLGSGILDICDPDQTFHSWVKPQADFVFVLKQCN